MDNHDLCVVSIETKSNSFGSVIKKRVGERIMFSIRKPRFYHDTHDRVIKTFLSI